MGDVRFPNFGGITINPPADNYHATFFKLMADKGAKTVVLLVENNWYTLAIAAGAEQLAAKYQITVLDKLIIDRHQVNPILRPPINFTANDIKQLAQLANATERIKALNPDFVALGAFPDLSRNVMNALFNASYLPKAVGGTSGLTPQLLSEFVQTGGHGTYFMSTAAGAAGMRVRCIRT